MRQRRAGVEGGVARANIAHTSLWSWEILVRPSIFSQPRTRLGFETWSSPQRTVPVSAVLSTEGRVVELCWEHLKPKGPKGLCWELEEPKGPKGRKGVSLGRVGRD